MTVDFCLPAKNEELILETNLKKLLEFLKSPARPYEWRVTVVINGSTDNSVLIANRLAATERRLSVLVIKKPGKSRALKECFRQSLADLLVMMDMDLSASLDDIDNLLSPLLDSTADLVIGSRALSQSQSQRSWSRRFVSSVYNFLSRFVLKHNFQDLQCGFKALKHGLFNDLEAYFIDNDWFLDTELVVLAYRLGYRVKEIPIEWREFLQSGRRTKIKIFKDTWLFIKALSRFRSKLKKIDLN